MSFILDALKKSESDRQQKATPDISDVPTAGTRAGTPRLLMAATGLLSITVAILLTVLLWPGRETALRSPLPQVAPATTAAPPPGAADAPDRPAAAPPNAPAATTANVAALESAPATAVPASVNTSRDMPLDTAEVANNSSSTVKTAVTDANAKPAATASAPPANEETESYLTLNDLRATGKITLPDMHIDLHVYSEIPSERFVFINMNQYRENATLSEGPRLRQITSDGVILEYVGTTFLLPRE